MPPSRGLRAPFPDERHSRRNLCDESAAGSVLGVAGAVLLDVEQEAAQLVLGGVAEAFVGGALAVLFAEVPIALTVPAEASFWLP
jgi:hypothetical protein